MVFRVRFRVGRPLSPKHSNHFERHHPQKKLLENLQDGIADSGVLTKILLG